MSAGSPNPEQPVAEALARRTLELVDIPSESHHEAAILARVADAMAATGAAPRLDTGSAQLYGPERPAVVLAGHVDTVPVQGNRPGRLAGDVVHGLGASDMKGGVAVMLELAAARPDLGYLFFAREELPVAESALPEVLEASAGLRETGLVVMLEPTDCALEVGCLGNLFAELRFAGTATHSARPWTGDNALDRAIRGLSGLVGVPERTVRMGEAEYREVLSLTALRAGVARNVIPGEAVAEINFRYGPDRTPAGAEERLAELVAGGGELTIVSNAPPAPAPVDNPHVERLRSAGAGPVRAKQAWTPVAEFAGHGIPAVNLGPGDPSLAHQAAESVTADALARCYTILSSL